MTRFLFPSLLATLALSSSVWAKLEPSLLFKDHMVLQRDAKIPVWGTDRPNSEVIVRLGLREAKTKTGADGRWIAWLPAMSMGAPTKMEITSGSEKITVNDILIGDVWLCSGQSNMQMSVKETTTANLAKADPMLRLFVVHSGGNKEPQTAIEGSWLQATPATISDFSAVAYFFGQSLRSDPALAKIPQALISSSLGGTAIEGWIPKEALASFPPDQQSASMFGIPASELYNGKIHPLAPFPIKGVVWYQGEANGGKPEVYLRLLEAFVTSWRKTWNDPDLPFLIVQLPPFVGKMGHYFTGVREAQMAASEKLPNVWTAVTLNTTDGTDLHPPEKREIGQRLALLAEKHIYGEKVDADSPKPKSVRIDGKAIVIEMDELSPKTPAMVRSFEIAGADGEYFFAKASVKGNMITVWSDGVPEPRTVRHAWSAVPPVDLVNSAGIPARPFRTDTLPIESFDFEEDAAPHTIETPVYRLTISGVGKITSLGVNGVQFLSNDLGLNSGAGFTGSFWGSRELRKRTEIGPRRILLSDNGGSVEVACVKDSMMLKIINRSDDNSQFRIPLAAGTTIEQNGDSIRAKRDSASIEFTGVKKNDDLSLSVEVPKHEEREIVLEMTK